MVRAAQKAAFDKADDDNVVVKTKFVGGIAQVRTSHSTRYYNKPLSPKQEIILTSVHQCWFNVGETKVNSVLQE